MGPELSSIPAHESRLLQLADAAPEAATVPNTFLLELDHAASGASALFTDEDLLHHATAAVSGHSNRSDFTQTADLEQHDLAMDEAVRASNQAANNSHTPGAQAASDATASEASTTAASEGAAKDNQTGSEQLEDSQGVGYISGEEILGLVGLTGASDPTANASHTDSKALSDSSSNSSYVANRTHKHDPGVPSKSTPPATPVCAIHPDLPIPGMDIAPADKDRCYAHPHIYKNNNYLNDSYYMLYHHDIPTIHPHPAFTWGDISRFAKVSRKMRRKEPVTVTFVGGSVSSSYCQNPSVTCWVAPVSAWLKELNPAVQIINNAVGGTTSRTTAECFNAMVGKEADLIFLEYSYNDRWACVMHRACNDCDLHQIPDCDLAGSCCWVQVPASVCECTLCMAVRLIPLACMSAGHD